jgi:hypothetical protein
VASFLANMTGVGGDHFTSGGEGRSLRFVPE